MTTLVESPTIGMEHVAREGAIVLIETLNEELQRQEEAWEDRDKELAEAKGVDFEPITLEAVELENFYVGHVPSLINAPIEKYPNVSVEADRAGASTSNTLDQATTYGISMYVEFMVKSEKSAEEASARSHRMLDAINNCLMSNRTLRGVIQEFDDAPTVQLSDVFTRKEQSSYGSEWFWRGGRLEYVPKKVAAMPSGDFLRAASMSDIDQA